MFAGFCFIDFLFFRHTFTFVLDLPGTGYQEPKKYMPKRKGVTHVILRYEW